MKKVLSILLAAAILITLFAIAPLSASALKSGDYEYEVLGDGTAEITKYTGTAEKLTIPSKLGGHKVTSVGESSFYGNASLKSIAFPDSVTAIGRYAFYNCSSLETVNMPDSITSIGIFAFQYCTSIKTITLPKSITSLSSGIFAHCFDLTSVTIPDSVTRIESYAFYICGLLPEITIPASVTMIDAYALYGCNHLSKITIPDSVTNIDRYAFGSCGGLTAVTIGSRVSNIDEYAFRNCISLNTVKIGKSVASIGKKAFNNCLSLNSVTIPASVTSIGDCAFGFDDIDQMIPGFKVLGKPGTASEEYAKKYGFAFEDAELAKTPQVTGITNTYEGQKIAWKKISGTPKYRVFVKTNGVWKKVGDSDSTSLVNTNVVSGSKYTYTVRGLAADGKTFVGSYNTTGWTKKFTAAPRISTIDNTNDGQKLVWGKVTGAAKYRAFVQINGKWKTLGDTAETSFVNTKVESGVSYTYTVRCVSSDGTSDTSGHSAKGWTRKFVKAPVLKTVKSTSGGVKLTWAKSAGAAKYRVFLKVDGNWKKLTDTTATSYVHTKAVSGKTYTYTVRCVSSDGKNYTSGFDRKGLTIKYVK